MMRTVVVLGEPQVGKSVLCDVLRRFMQWDPNHPPPERGPAASRRLPHQLHSWLFDRRTLVLEFGATVYKEMLKAVGVADAALIVVRPGQPRPTATCALRQQLLAAAAAGARRAVLAVTALDAEADPAAAFEAAQDVYLPFIRSCGMAPIGPEACVPVSGARLTNVVPAEGHRGFVAWLGDGVDIDERPLPWAWAQRSLVEALQDLPEAPRKPGLEEAPFRMVLYKFYKVRGVGLVVAGRVLSGTLRPGSHVRLWLNRRRSDDPGPDHVDLQITKGPTDCPLEMEYRAVAQLGPGDVGTVRLHNVDILDLREAVSAGALLTEVRDDDTVPLTGTRFPPSAKREWMMYYSTDNASTPTFEADVTLALRGHTVRPGFTATLVLQCLRVPCRVTEVLGEPLVNVGDQTRVRLKVVHPTRYVPLFRRGAPDRLFRFVMVANKCIVLGGRLAPASNAGASLQLTKSARKTTTGK